MGQDMQSIARDTKEFLESIVRDNVDNAVQVFFCEKKPSDKYRTFMPQVKSDLQKRIIGLVLPKLLDSLDCSVVPYNPVGVLDNENEVIGAEQVSCIVPFLESLETNKLCTDMKDLEVSKINFYCIKITYLGKSVYLFRQFTKMSRLRKGILSQIVEDTLREMDNDFLGLDELTDIVLTDQKQLLIVNHISLERIFNYRDKFQEMTNQAIGRIVVEGIMTNIEQFSEDCLNDVRIMKRFTEMMSKERLPLFFDNYDRVPEIVSTLGLDIDFDRDGKMIYRDRSQLFHIIHLMSDSYFKSLIAERVGVAEMEGTI